MCWQIAAAGIIVAVAFRQDAAPQGDQPQPTSEAATARGPVQGANKKLNTPQAAYREALRLEAELRQAWQREPGSNQLVDRKLVELGATLKSLHAFYDNDAQEKQSNNQSVVARPTSETAQPQQPAEATTEQAAETTADAQARRERALDETHRAPSPEAMKQRAMLKLADAPPEWLHKRSREATVLTRKIESALAQEVVGRREAEALLKELHETLLQMSASGKARRERGGASPEAPRDE
jgi:hypothetical protein